MVDSTQDRKQHTSNRTVWAIVAAIVFADLALMVSGYRVLLSETTALSPEMPSKTIDAGGVAIDSRFLPTSEGLLTCRYFTGRAVKTVHFAMVEGVDECPFLYAPKAAR